MRPNNPRIPCRNINPPARKDESGNAFFLIMIGVVLFAGLMFTFSRGARQGGDNLSEKQAEIAATEIIDYAQKLERTVNRILMRGISENDLSFAIDVFVSIDGDIRYSSAHHGNCSSTRCQVFNQYGGPLAPRLRPEPTRIEQPSPPFDSENDSLSGSGDFMVAAVEGIGTDLPELLFVYQFLNRTACVNLNEMLGVSNSGGNPPVEDHDDAVIYNGNVSGSEVLGDDAPALAGHTSFCKSNDNMIAGMDTYSFWQVLLAR